MKKIRSIILFLLIFAMFFSVPNITNAKPELATIKIGALGPLAITPGKDMDAGAKLAVKEINAAGGVTIDGTAYDLELIVETSSSPSTGLPDINTAVPNAEKLMTQDDVVAMLGLFRTEVTVAVQATLDRPFLGVGSTAPIITPYFWRVSPSNGSQLVRSLLDLYYLGLAGIGVKNVTIVREDAAWSLAMRGSIVGFLQHVVKVQNFTDDVVIAEGATYSTVESALTPIKEELDGLNVNAIMTIFSGPAGKHITKAWASLDMPQMLAGINVECQSSTHFAETEGAAYGELTLMGMPPDVNQTAKTGPFRQAYYEENGELPTYTAGTSYDAVYILADAMERADSYDSADIQAVLNETDYTGAAYRVKFTSEPNVVLDENGKPIGGHTSYLDNGTRVLIPGVPTNLTVHDLYTTGTVGVSGIPFTTGYWVQWQQNGTQKTVFGEDPVATRNISDYLEWPIVHSDHGYTSATPPPATPGFELPLVLFGLGNLVLIVIVRKRKKR
ncbi:MAG: ABC transporter substrate-binding protein [Candidatus Hodarchaeales archaeon]